MLSLCRPSSEKWAKFKDCQVSTSVYYVGEKSFEVQTREWGLVDDDQSDGKCHLVETNGPLNIFILRVKLSRYWIQTMGWSPITGREGSSGTAIGLGVRIIFGCICSFLLRIHVERTCHPEQGLLSLASHYPCSTTRCGTSHWPWSWPPRTVRPHYANANETRTRLCQILAKLTLFLRLNTSMLLTRKIEVKKWSGEKHQMVKVSWTMLASFL